MRFDTSRLQPRTASAEAASGVTDILAIGLDPALAARLSALFEPSGWIVREVPGCRAAIEFLCRNTVAVAVCHESLPDGSWRDLAARLGAVPNAPAWIVAGSASDLREEVAVWGGFDVLEEPVCETETTWTVASAWHWWMKRFEAACRWEATCSGA